MKNLRMIRKYSMSLLRHKFYVLLAGLRLGGIPIWRLIIHDWQKFTPIEFMRYARNFFGTEGTNDADVSDIRYEFSYAWLHHENTAPHHWGYWIPRSGAMKNKPLIMPTVFIREMIADWMGASKTYTGSWDMCEWLNDNLTFDAILGDSRIVLNGETLRRLEIILSNDLGYEYSFDIGWYKPRKVTL